MSKELNFEKGVIGEQMAVKFLKKRHFKILEKNFRCLIGEIDIIAQKGKIYHIVEVKYRKDIEFGYPREAVNEKKQHKIKRVAEFYFMINRIEEFTVSFDIVEIIGKEITFIENAFI